jgi:hypothetical protein
MTITAPNREQHQNLSSTTLNGAINNSVTTVTVTTGSAFPSAGNYRVMVDDEIMIVTARSTNDLTVVRGQDGTSAASHADLATIALVYSQQSLSRLFTDNDPSFGYSGTLMQGQLFNDDGKTLLTLSDFTWQNQGGASASDDNGTIFLNCPTDASFNARVLERTAPSTPYTYIAAFSTLCPLVDSDAKPGFGFGFRETSSSKLMVCTLRMESFFDNEFLICMQRFSSTTSLFTTNDGSRRTQIVSDLIWIKMENNGTNLKWYIGPDGVNWMLYFSESKTAWFSSGPDRLVWFGLNNGNSGSPSAELHVRLHHWSKGE